MDGLRFVVSHPFSPPRHGGRGGADSKRMAHPVWGDALIPKVMGGVPGRGSLRRKTWGVHRNVTRQSDGRYRFRESVWAMLARDGVPDGTRWGIWRPGREGEAACAAPKQPRTVAEAISVRRTSPQGVPVESFPILSPWGGDDPVEQGEGTRRRGIGKELGAFREERAAEAAQDADFDSVGMVMGNRPSKREVRVGCRGRVRRPESRIR